MTTSQAPAPTPASAPPPTIGVEQLEALLPPLAELSTLRLSAEGRFSGIRLLAQRALFRALRPLWFQQHQFHAQLVAALRTTAAAMRTEQRARETVDQRLRELTRRVLSGRREISRLARALENQRTVNGVNATFQQNASAHLEGLTGVLQKTEIELARLTERLYAVPYMAEPSRYLEKDAHGRERLGYSSRAASESGAYVGFEDVFRGSESMIRRRQEIYLTLLKPFDHVVDLGSGRGEMLDLLRDAGVRCTGVDTDADMVRASRAKGHDVKHQDALAFLREQPPHSIPALFNAQMIEHLPAAAFNELLELCRTRLRPGGVLIAETVNPHALEAFKTFYTDLTHERPIFPEVALVSCELAGFDRAYIFFPNGRGDLAEDRRTRGEYAVIASVL